MFINVARNLLGAMGYAAIPSRQRSSEDPIPSEKVKAILLSQSSLAAERIEAMTDRETWDLVYALKPERTEPRRSICLTGFAASEKVALASLVKAHGHAVADKV